jgi:hypothetical protein
MLPHKRLQLEETGLWDCLATTLGRGKRFFTVAKYFSQSEAKTPSSKYGQLPKPLAGRDFGDSASVAGTRHKPCISLVIQGNGNVH